MYPITPIELLGGCNAIDSLDFCCVFEHGIQTGRVGDAGLSKELKKGYRQGRLVFKAKRHLPGRFRVLLDEKA